jgi:O-methyltransferase involved in polyketide biosynthesis
MKAFSEQDKQASIDQRASRTAMMAATHRFLASKEEQPHFRGPDHLAALFLAPKAKFFLAFAWMHRFGIQEGTIESFLAEHGFELLSHHTPNEFEKTYLYDEHEGFFGKMYGFACHVHVRVKP